MINLRTNAQSFGPIFVLLIGTITPQATCASDTNKSETKTWNFDSDEPGRAPAGWNFAFTKSADGKAAWTISKDADARSAPNILTLIAESGDSTFNLAFAQKTSLKDVDLRAEIRPNTGKEDQGGGLIWRAKDVNNYYICRINPLESNFRVYKVIDGKRQQLQSVDVKTQLGKWHALRAKMVGDHIMCFLGDKKLLDVTDGTLKDAGMIGLWTKADASSSFDNLSAGPAPASAEDAPRQPDRGAKREDADADEEEDDDDEDDD